MSNHIIQKVTGLHIGFSNSALRTPYALIKLACGHMPFSVQTVGCLLECECGAKFRESGPYPSNEVNKCACGNTSGIGGRGFRILALPDPHKTKDRLTLPVACRCEQCEKEEADLALIPEYVAQSVYSRFREWGGGIITFYRRDPKSPTGVIALATISATKRAEAEIRRCNSSISPLSPTEGLRQ